MNIATSPLSSLAPSPRSSRYRNPHAKPKAALCHRTNLAGFFDDYGVDHCALLTLVFGRHVRWIQASKNLQRAQRTLLDPLFVDWICVVELHKDGHPHFHFVVAHAGNLRAGFDFNARGRARSLSRQAAAEGRRLNPAESVVHKQLIRQSYQDASVLREVWDHLRRRLPDYGFGRAHPGSLEPVFNPEALANYLVKSFGRDALPRPAELKGVRLVRYSQRLNRRANQRFAWDTPLSRLSRRQVACIAAALGVEDGEFATFYGRRWYRQLMELVENLMLVCDRPDGEPCWPPELIRQAAPRFMPRVGRILERDIEGMGER